MTAIATRNPEQLIASGVLASTGIAAALSPDDAKMLVPYVATVTSASRWWRADLAKALGNQWYDWLATEFGCSSATVQQDVATAKAWPFELRVEGASFNHHRILNSYIEPYGFDTLRDVLQLAAEAQPKPTPEGMLLQFLNTVSQPKRYVYQPRYAEFERWLADVTGLEVTASNSTLWISTDNGTWRAVAALDGGRPVIDWKFEQGE